MPKQNPPSRAVIWAAVSTPPQAKKVSIEDQLSQGRTHAAKHGLSIVEELIVPGESRSIVLFEDAARKIPAYARLKELIDAEAFDVFIFYNRGRLGRIAALSMAVVGLCEEASIIPYNLEAPPPSLDYKPSASDRMVGAISSVSEQEEVIRLVARHTSGMVGRINDGKFAGTIPFGWYVANYNERGYDVEINEPEAAVIRQIFKMYLDDRLGVRQIADRLNEQGAISVNGEGWTRNKVSNVFRMTKRYAGINEYNRRNKRGMPTIEAKGRWPAIIDTTTLNAVLAERSYRKTNRRSALSPYRFSGLCWCAICGERMRLTHWQSKGRQWSYIRCPSTTHPLNAISEKIIMEVLHDYIESLQAMTNFSALIISQDEIDIEPQIERLNAQLTKCTADLKRADTAYVGGAMDYERYLEQIDAIKKRQAAINRQIEELHEKQKESEHMAGLGERLEAVRSIGTRHLHDSDIAMSNAWLRSVFQVWIGEKKAIEIRVL